MTLGSVCVVASMIQYASLRTRASESVTRIMGRPRKNFNESLEASDDRIDVRKEDYVFCDKQDDVSPYFVGQVKEIFRDREAVFLRLDPMFRREDLPRQTFVNFEASLRRKICPPRGKTADDELKFYGLPKDAKKHSAQDIEVLRHHELITGRTQVDVDSRFVRGKCRVRPLGDFDTTAEFLANEDLFFRNSAVEYDELSQRLQDPSNPPHVINVGPDHQVHISDWDPELAVHRPSDEEYPDRDECVWNNPVVDLAKLAKFRGRINHLFPSNTPIPRRINIAISTQLLDVNNSENGNHEVMFEPYDFVTIAAHDFLHRHNYNFDRAWKAILESARRGRSFLVDPIEKCQFVQWSLHDVELMVNGLRENYAKDFVKIREKYLPLKKLSQVIEFYHQFKTTAYYKGYKNELVKRKQRYDNIHIGFSLQKKNDRDMLQAYRQEGRSGVLHLPPTPFQDMAPPRRILLLLLLLLDPLEEARYRICADEYQESAPRIDRQEKDGT
ncbi:hypothetical protein L596_028261 [Steinernema carpocapsae]|uniref:ELM2 domain-containing protein n=2 Tax=Steinernema carpocapsae TaxID=34508 RepID=A0A4U5LXW8_STECR|nr:hypothetical protein L596_028261 [Steinernema carpocapsae]